MKQHPIGIWRAQPVPELHYLSPTATRPRSHSGLGLVSLLVGCVLAVAVLVAAARMDPWSVQDGNRLAVAALPACIVGAALGVVGLVRRSKRRILGGLGLLVNVAVALGVAWLWFVTHIAT